MTGRVALVTGATRGIGLALAEGYVCAGAKVAVVSRDEQACKETAKHLQDLGGDAIGPWSATPAWSRAYRSSEQDSPKRSLSSRASLPPTGPRSSPAPSSRSTAGSRRSSHDLLSQNT